MNSERFFKLDLGSGNKPYRDYQGVDIGGGDKSVIKEDILIFLKKLPKNSVSHIYSRHYLEHAGSDQVIKILDEIDRVLIKKGEITQLPVTDDIGVTTYLTIIGALVLLDKV